MVYLKTTYELCLEAYFEGVNAVECFESCDFSPRKYKNVQISKHIHFRCTIIKSMFMFDLRMINIYIINVILM